MSVDGDTLCPETAKETQDEGLDFSGPREALKLMILQMGY